MPPKKVSREEIHRRRAGENPLAGVEKCEGAEDAEKDPMPDLLEPLF